LYAFNISNSNIAYATAKVDDIIESGKDIKLIIDKVSSRFGRGHLAFQPLSVGAYLNSLISHIFMLTLLLDEDLEKYPGSNERKSKFGEKFTICISRVSGSRRKTKTELANSVIHAEKLQSVLFPRDKSLKRKTDKHHFKELGVTLGVG